MSLITTEIISGMPFGNYPPRYKNEYAPFCDTLEQNLLNWNNGNYPYESYENYYDINEQGYREKSWKDINWNNVILCLGCSFMDGLGVSKEHSIPGLLTKLTSINCVNLSSPGFGVQAMVDISSTLINLGITPKAVIMQYSFWNRFYDIKTKKTIIPSTFAEINDKNLRKVYKAHINYNDVEDNMLYCQKILKALWKNTTTFSYNISFVDEYNQEYITDLGIPTLSPIVNLNSSFIRARDYFHGGLDSNMHNATIIYNNIKNKL